MRGLGRIEKIKPKRQTLVDPTPAISNRRLDCGVTIQPPGGVDLDVGVTRLRGRLCNLATYSHRGVAHRNTPK